MIPRNYFTNAEGHWIESYKAFSKTFEAAFNTAFNEYKRSNEVANANDTVV